MPIYFNLESHFWIVGLFLLNGLMVTWILRHFSVSFRAFTIPFESQVLSAFFISLAINGVVLLLLDMGSMNFSLAKWPLILTFVVLVSALYWFVIRHRDFESFRFEMTFARLALYIFVFVMLFYNGGFIEQVSDSWWHMSLANKVYLQSTYSPEPGHLIGLPTRYYPPLWHGNIALAKQVSGVSIPVYWNSLTAWVGMFKVMAFYLFAFGISKNKSLAILAAILFVLLPGMGVSFLRVSAWPSHVAYTAWFAMFYVAALILDELPNTGESAMDISHFPIKVACQLVMLFVLMVLVYFIHKAEILWFAIAWFSYLVAASFSRTLAIEPRYIVSRDHLILRYFYRVILLLLIAYASWFAIQSTSFGKITDESLSYLLPVLLISILFAIDVQFKSKVVSYGLVAVFIVLVAMSINFIHLVSLFSPELALPRGGAYESPSVATGYLGGKLNVPGWHLQLRSGLLYSGVLSIFGAIVMMVISPSRVSLLVAGSSVVAIVLCLSPYLYHWLQLLLGYHSPWRVSLIIFHPVTWALAIVVLNDARKRRLKLDYD